MLTRLKSSGKGNRLSFLGDKKQPVFILHKSTIDNALIERALAGDKVADLKLRELFKRLSGLKELAEKSFGIVTEDGRKDSPIIGWITNVIVEENSRV